MTRLAELWNQLTDAEREGVFWAARNMIGDPGGDLILAVAAHAEEHTPAPRPTPAPVPEPQICPDCGHPIDGKPTGFVIEINGGNKVVWLCRICWRDRMMHQTRTCPEPTHAEETP